MANLRNELKTRYGLDGDQATNAIVQQWRLDATMSGELQELEDSGLASVEMAEDRMQGAFAWLTEDEFWSAWVWRQEILDNNADAE